MKPQDIQIGGSHYKDMKIQPEEFIYQNGIGFHEGNAIKYLCRWKKKDGVKDLEKAKHYIDLLIQHLKEENWMGEVPGNEVTNDVAIGYAVHNPYGIPHAGEGYRFLDHDEVTLRDGAEFWNKRTKGWTPSTSIGCSRSKNITYRIPLKGREVKAAFCNMEHVGVCSSPDCYNKI